MPQITLTLTDTEARAAVLDILADDMRAQARLLRMPTK